MAYVDGLELVEPAGRNEWRAWLEANHATSRGIALAVAKKNGSWMRLERPPLPETPDDLKAALAATAGAAESFEKASASQRRMALYWIDDAKRPETRTRRIASVVSAAAEGRPLVG